jgi:hypothetical protein
MISLALSATPVIACLETCLRDVSVNRSGIKAMCRPTAAEVKRCGQLTN